MLTFNSLCFIHPQHSSSCLHLSRTSATLSSNCILLHICHPTHRKMEPYEDAPSDMSWQPEGSLLLIDPVPTVPHQNVSIETSTSHTGFGQITYNAYPPKTILTPRRPVTRSQTQIGVHQYQVASPYKASSRTNALKSTKNEFVGSSRQGSAYGLARYPTSHKRAWPELDRSESPLNPKRDNLATDNPVLASGWLHRDSVSRESSKSSIS